MALVPPAAVATAITKQAIRRPMSFAIRPLEIRIPFSFTEDFRRSDFLILGYLLAQWRKANVNLSIRRTSAEIRTRVAARLLVTAAIETRIGARR
jgi:hypothetical protein